jgi:hypothetical protein
LRFVLLALSCQKAGMDDFLTKPCTGAKLRGAVAKWLPLHELPPPWKDNKKIQMPGGGPGLDDEYDSSPYLSVQAGEACDV